MEPVPLFQIFKKHSCPKTYLLEEKLCNTEYTIDRAELSENILTEFFADTEEGLGLCGTRLNTPVHAVDVDVVITDLSCDLTDDARLVFVLHCDNDRSQSEVCLITEEAYENFCVVTDDRTGNGKFTAFFCYEVNNDHAGVTLALCALALDNFDAVSLNALTYVNEAYASVGMSGEEALQNRECQDPR